MEWTGARYADKPTVQVRIWVGAPPARVWELVSDIGLMPAMSSELQSVEWLDGADGPAVGARFAAHPKPWHEALRRMGGAPRRWSSSSRSGSSAGRWAIPPARPR